MTGRSHLSPTPHTQLEHRAEDSEGNHTERPPHAVLHGNGPARVLEVIQLHHAQREHDGGQQTLGARERRGQDEQQRGQLAHDPNDDEHDRQTHAHRRREPIGGAHRPREPGSERESHRAERYEHRDLIERERDPAHHQGADSSRHPGANGGEDSAVGRSGNQPRAQEEPDQCAHQRDRDTDHAVPGKQQHEPHHNRQADRNDDLHAITVRPQRRGRPLCQTSSTSRTSPLTTLAGVPDQPADPATFPTPPPLPAPRGAKLWSESRRALISTLVGSIITVVAVTLWRGFNDVDGSLVFALGTMLTWAIFVAVHAFLTWYAFRGLTGEQLETALQHTGFERSADRVRPSWSIQVSAMALVAVALLVAVPSLREHQLLLGTALAMVVACWADMVISFALHYATIDDGGFDFPSRTEGQDERTFGDYLYLAVTVQATFGPPDVAVTTSALRRQLSVHTVLAFLFNTVNLAVIVTLMLGN